LKIYTLTAAAAACLCLSACSTVTTLENGASQHVMVTTPPAKGAICVLTNSRGRWQVITPGSAHVLRSRDDLRVTCKKPGFAEASTVDRSESVIQTWDIYADAIDASNGSGHQYTPEIVIPMTEVAAPPPVTPPLATP
jgi:hypothetical protein